MADKKTIAVKLTRDYWVEADVRVSAGAIIDVTVDAALKLLDSGVATRTDPLPGQE
jgi:hypothetical protein